MVVIFLIIIMAILNVFTVFASEMETTNLQELDCTSDLQKYMEVVALLSRYTNINDPDTVSDIPAFAGEENSLILPSHLREAAPLFAVILRTDGTDPLPFETDRVAMIKGPEDRYMMYYASEESAEMCVALLNKQDGILYAECDSEVFAAEEKQAFNSWGAVELRLGEYLSFINSWGTGSGSTVSIIDSGVCRHPFISPKMPESGYDFIDADNDATNDLNGHGTHVAGIVVDCTVSAPVQIYPIRVLGANGRGKMENVVSAIADAREKGVDIINLSVESSKSSDALDYEIRECVNSGCVVVAAAGNGNRDASDVSPAHMTDEGVIVVGSVDLKNGEVVRASSSNYGDSVDFYSFGNNISSCSIDGGYIKKSGTSMAAPHVSGICALLRLLHPEETPAETEERIRKSVHNYSGMMVPSLDLMIPKEEGFYLTQVTMKDGDRISLPLYARPSSSWEDIEYISSNQDVVDIESGKLEAVRTGTSTVTVKCTGFEDRIIYINVVEGNVAKIDLPSSLKILGEEALYGIGEIHELKINNNLKTIGDNAFDISNTGVFIYTSTIPNNINLTDLVIMICPVDSIAELYSKENYIQYISIN